MYENWLEYSVPANKAFCLCCYLFRDSIPKQGGNCAFVTEGFSSWNKPETLKEHVGEEPNTYHNIAVKKCDDLMNQGQSIVHALNKQDNATKMEYHIRLNASIDASRYFLRHRLLFRGHDESKESSNRGNFLELVKYIEEQNADVSKVILGNIPGNNQMVSLVIQKDIAHSFAEEVLKYIIKEIDHGVFGLLVDESADISEEQMAVVFRFVDKSGAVKERFIGVVHVKDTFSLSLKSAIDELFAKYGLSLKKVRGQGYDRASNMRGEFNGLRSLISRENSSQYYVHCFAHQLQLVVVAVAKKHFDIGDFFDMISTLLNMVGTSCKRKDFIRESYRKKVQDGNSSGDIFSGTGLNQELSFQRPGNTRKGSHRKTLQRLVELFLCIIEVLEYIENDGIEDSKRC